MSSRHRSAAVCALGAVGALLLLSACGEEAVTAAPAQFAAAPVVPVADVVTVTRIVDGDTVDVSDGRRVRLLGIDSCEIGTSAGTAATAAATERLLFRPVTLVAEPGVDLDPSGRSLRYVRMPDGQDFGRAMVPFGHTGVYEGGDAGAQYMSELRPLDADGRTCDPPAPTTSSSPPPPPPVVQEDDDDRPYVPVPSDDDSRSSRSSGSDGSDGSGGSGSSSATKPRTGNSGHPCRPGERDGDKDGYCGEGR